MKKIDKILLPLFLFLFVGCTDYYTRQAEQAENIKDYVTAIKFLDKIIQRQPDNVIAYIDRGVDKSLIKDYHGAIDDYTQVIKLDSAHILAWVNRGKNRYRLDDYVLAVSDYNTALNLKKTVINGTAQYWDNSLDSRDVSYVQIVFERGMAYYELDSLNKAFHDFNDCITRSYLLERSYYFRGMIYKLSGHPTEAANDFKAVLRYGSAQADSDYEIEAKAQLKALEHQ